MTRLAYAEADLLAEHPYARPQIEAGYRLHGGFDDAGAYISPRTLGRWPAVKAWQEALEHRSWPLVNASTSLLRRGNYPNFAQQRLLLDLGLGETLWNALTVTGAVEARGRFLADVMVPDFQPIIVEDIAGTATGHLGKGLMKAHGFDEGGNADKGEGGHDVMWYAARDLLFGRDAYPLPEIPPSLARPEQGRLMSQLPLPHEQTILLLMNVLMIEIRAEAFFSFCIQLMQAPDVFADRRGAARHAAELVERIRQDEAIHVAYLQTAVSELRSFTFRGANGQRVPGKSVIDPVWNGMVRWHSVTTLEHAEAQKRQMIETQLLALPGGPTHLAAFDALADRDAA